MEGQYSQTPGPKSNFFILKQLGGPEVFLEYMGLLTSARKPRELEKIAFFFEKIFFFWGPKNEKKLDPLSKLVGFWGPLRGLQNPHIIFQKKKSWWYIFFFTRQIFDFFPFYKKKFL